MIRQMNLQKFAEDGEAGAAAQKDAGKAKSASPFEKLIGVLKAQDAGDSLPADTAGAKKGADAADKSGADDSKAKDDDTKKADTIKDDSEGDTQADAEFDEIVYNKETVKIPKSERKTYLQKGYNYDKVKQAADKAKEDSAALAAVLQRAAKAAGYKDAAEYVKELDRIEREKLAEDIASAEGDPDKLEAVIENHPVVKQTKAEKEKLAREKALATVKETLRQDRFFKDLEEKFDEITAAHPTVPPELLYKTLRSDYLTTEKLDELIGKEKQEAAKEKEAAVKAAIADIQDRSKRGTPKGGDAEGDEPNEAVKPNKLTSDIAKAFGLSPTKVARRSLEMKKSG